MRERGEETRCLMSYRRFLGAGLASAIGLISLSMFQRHRCRKRRRRHPPLRLLRER